MEYKNILVDKRDAVVTITFNRPGVLNAMSLELWDELYQAISALKLEKETRVVVLRGAGNRAFSAGTDVKSSYETLTKEVEKVGRTIHGCCREIMQIPQVVIGVVHGYCFGAALELILSCDYAIATGKAVFSLPEMRLGLPCMVEAALLVPAVGLFKAREMCYFAWNYEASKAEKMGLVNEVVPDEKLEERLNNIISELIEKDGAALGIQKDIIYKWLTTDLEAAMQYSILAMKLVEGSPAQVKAMKAFLNKEKK